MEKPEGWVERDDPSNSEEEDLPKGLWREQQYKENKACKGSRETQTLFPMEGEIKSKSNDDKEDIADEDYGNQSKEKMFKFKKKGKRKESEIQDLKRANKSMFGWIKKLEATSTSPSNPLAMNDVQEETDNMEWEVVEMEEKLERVKRKQENRKQAGAELC